MVAGAILAAVMVSWVAFHLLSGNSGPPSVDAEPNYPLTPTRKPTRGFFAGTLAALVIGGLTFCGPLLLGLEHAEGLMWLSVMAAPFAALIGGVVVQRVVSSRAKAAEKTRSGSRNS